MLVSIRSNGIWLRKTEELEDKFLIFVPLIGGQKKRAFLDCIENKGTGVKDSSPLNHGYFMDKSRVIGD